MKVLVTGAAGYMGKHVIGQLLKENYDIIATDICDFDVDKKVEKVVTNVFDIKSRAALNADALIHLAWQDNFNHQSINHLRNISRHYEFIQWMIENGCTNINSMGSMHEVGYFEGAIDENTPCNPLSLYGIAKNSLRQGLLLLNAEKVYIKWLRAYYITGDDWKNNSIFSKIIQKEKEGEEFFPFTSGKNKYDFIDIDTLAMQIVRASMQTDETGVINVCSGEPVELKDKVEDFLRSNNMKIRLKYGVYPDRIYDSPAVWGNNARILRILEKGK